MKKFLSVLKVIVIVLLSLTVIVAAGFGIRDIIKSHNSTQFEVTDERLNIAVENAVTSDIGNHKTITFCSPDEQTISRDENTYVVSGYVDTTDAKDNTTRTHYTVKVTFVAEDMFRLDSCNLF